LEPDIATMISLRESGMFAASSLYNPQNLKPET